MSIEKKLEENTVLLATTLKRVIVLELKVKNLHDSYDDLCISHSIQSCAYNGLLNYIESKNKIRYRILKWVWPKYISPVDKIVNNIKGSLS